MKPANVFQLEWLAAWGSWRAALLRLGVTLLLGGPLIVVDAPPAVQAGGLTMVILFTSLFGASVAHERRRSDGRLRALAVLPIPPALRWLDQFLAGVAGRLVPAAALLVLYMGLRSPNVWAVATVTCAAWLVVTVAAAQALGMLVARVAAGGGAVHLVSALVVGAWALLSGLFPTPSRLAPVVQVTSWASPPGQLARALRQIAGETGRATGPAWPAWVIAAAVLAALAWRAGGAAAKGETESALTPSGVSAILHATTEQKSSHAPPSADSGSTRP